MQPIDWFSDAKRFRKLVASELQHELDEGHYATFAIGFCGAAFVHGMMICYGALDAPGNMLVKGVKTLDQWGANRRHPPAQPPDFTDVTIDDFNK